MEKNPNCSESPETHFYRPQGKVMFSQLSVSHSVHNWPHAYSVTAHPCHGAVGTHPTGMLSCCTINPTKFALHTSFCNFGSKFGQPFLEIKHGFLVQDFWDRRVE